MQAPTTAAVFAALAIIARAATGVTKVVDLCRNVLDKGQRAPRRCIDAAASEDPRRALVDDVRVRDRDRRRVRLLPRAVRQAQLSGQSGGCRRSRAAARRRPRRRKGGVMLTLTWPVQTEDRKALKEPFTRSEEH